MTSIYDEMGKMAMGSRLRRLAELFTDENRAVYADNGIPMEPRWFPVLYAIWKKNGEVQGGLTTTEIADWIGHSHASVSQIVKEMVKKDMLETEKSNTDARCSHLRLSAKAQGMLPALEGQLADVEAAVEQLQRESQFDLFRAIAEMEYLLDQKSLRERIREQRKLRERQEVQIFDYTPEYHNDFRNLNHEWITRFFRLEESDNLALDHPDEKILKPGGHIYLAKYRGEVVGTCALIKMSDDRYELAKMAVTERAKGKHIGFLLGQACLKKARELGAMSVFLESNTKLKPAITLYHKLGFQKIVGEPSPYDRCNIQMEVRL
ncbi:MAG: GNAT family N-acetyltransferase [Cytophagales bacterium]|nr:MAG: GNAT family N-acetyltransferase [Cytophagales bacterium]